MDMDLLRKTLTYLRTLGCTITKPHLVDVWFTIIINRGQFRLKFFGDS